MIFLSFEKTLISAKILKNHHFCPNFLKKSQSYEFLLIFQIHLSVDFNPQRTIDIHEPGPPKMTANQAEMF